MSCKDHGHPHLVVRNGSGKRSEAEVKARIETFEVLGGFGFSEKAVNEIVKSLRTYRKRLLEIKIFSSRKYFQQF